MKQLVQVPIECGETTCASQPGCFCHLMTWNAMSGKPNCFLFGDLTEKEGWVQRHQECISPKN